MVKSCEKWRKVGKKYEKVVKVAKSGGHFSPFQINTQLFFLNLFKMAASRHFGSPFWAILDDRKLLSIAFLGISDQYTTFWKSDLRQKQ